MELDKTRMYEARYNHTANIYLNSKIVIFGGEDIFCKENK